MIPLVLDLDLITGLRTPSHGFLALHNQRILPIDLVYLHDVVLQPGPCSYYSSLIAN